MAPSRRLAGRTLRPRIDRSASTGRACRARRLFRQSNSSVSTDRPIAPAAPVAPVSPVTLSTRDRSVRWHLSRPSRPSASHLRTSGPTVLWHRRAGPGLFDLQSTGPIAPVAPVAPVSPVAPFRPRDRSVRWHLCAGLALRTSGPTGPIAPVAPVSPSTFRTDRSWHPSRRSRRSHLRPQDRPV